MTANPTIPDFPVDGPPPGPTGHSSRQPSESSETNFTLPSHSVELIAERLYRNEGDTCRLTILLAAKYPNDAELAELAAKARASLLTLSDRQAAFIRSITSRRGKIEIVAEQIGM